MVWSIKYRTSASAGLDTRTIRCVGDMREGLRWSGRSQYTLRALLLSFAIADRFSSAADHSEGVSCEGTGAGTGTDEGVELSVVLVVLIPAPVSESVPMDALSSTLLPSR
jgi:hypothetical protein